MTDRDKIIILTILLLTFGLSLISKGQDCYNYRNTTDNLRTKITFDNNLHSEFFKSHEASYPWYIIKNDNGTFENVSGEEITAEDKIPIEHTANCLSTHQGRHIMNFCNANLDSGILRLEIYGGMPAYSGSLLLTVKDPEFTCHFKAAYPAPVSNCKWNILSKKIIFKSKDINKGKRIYAWVSVEFEETSVYRGKTTINKYRIEGYIKPVVK